MVGAPSGLRYYLDLDLDLLETYGERMRKLNQTITDDSALGRQYCIGHSFLTPAGERQDTDLDTRQWWRRVVKTDIKPLLEEYWFDRMEAADEAVRKLLGG